MIRPAAEELLAGIAESLDEHVLPQLEPGAARIQVEMAIVILRRLAVAVPKTVPYFEADNADIEETLLSLAPVLGPHLALLHNASASEAAGASPGDALAATNRGLHEAVAGVVPLLASSSALDPQSRVRLETALRALFRRMLDRELELSPGSPYGR